MSQNKADDAAKLRIRKESDFNITEFFRIICVFFGDNSCGFIRIRYLCIRNAALGNLKVSFHCARLQFLCRIILIRISQKKL